MVRGMAEMATLKKQNKRLQDKMNQLRQMCDKQQSVGKTTLEVRTILKECKPLPWQIQSKVVAFGQLKQTQTTQWTNQNSK